MKFTSRYFRLGKSVVISTQLEPNTSWNDFLKSWSLSLEAMTNSADTNKVTQTSTNPGVRMLFLRSSGCESACVSVVLISARLAVAI